MDVMDLLYEKGETSLLFSAPRSLAASILACFQPKLLYMWSRSLNNSGNFQFFPGLLLSGSMSGRKMFQRNSHTTFISRMVRNFTLLPYLLLPCHQLFSGFMLLQCLEYFGQYGKVPKVSMCRTTAGNI
ncbi:hypothetical protein J1N35_037514 [Gossypium stocksii]|uniref:Uncharacterized protein n=1 Tax=Gossypium stocksii TaxID=47602 RepID=A0A9D3ZLY2_9ROSI|nr:hypothetical protein J1N35_037514 [Gossypium stocksii]